MKTPEKLVHYFLISIVCLGTSALAARAAERSPLPPPGPSTNCIRITSKASLLHLGSLDSFDITEGGKKAARLILDYFEKSDTNAVAEALKIYKEIIPNENFGGEYTALQWMCEYLLAPEPQKQSMLADPLVNAFQEFFSATNYLRLRTYLLHKYHLNSKDQKIDKLEMRFLEDFILFNNPRREHWEKTSKIIEAINLKPGDLVADVGSGPGYYTYKFAKAVGPTGRVFASEINPRHCEYLTNLVKKLGLSNVEVIHSQKDEIGVGKAPPPNGPTNAPGFANGAVPPDPSKRQFMAQTNNVLGFSNKVDLAFLCSLYHILYTDTEQNLTGLLDSIKRILKSDGTLAIIDNALVEDSTLPYHGPFIAKELIITQLEQYGFRLAGYHQFIPQRYLLLFKPTNEARPRPPELAAPAALGTNCILPKSRKSLIRLQAYMPSEKGRTAARNLVEGLEKNDLGKIREARQQFTELVPVENFGAEYLSLQWFCDYILAPAKEQPKFLTNPLTSDYFHYFADTNWAVLKEFLKRRNQLVPFPDMETSEGQDRMSDLQDWIYFNNPRREQWEKTSLIMKALKLKRGAYIADVGCGTGYYTFPFAEAVGRRGRVFAIETNEKHIQYLMDFVKRNRIANVRPIRSKLNDICCEEQCDLVFLCSLYPMVYVTSMEKVKDHLMETIKKAMKPDGRLVIVDNDIVEEPTLPYHASCMDRRLIIEQLKYYGFRLVETHQFIPQRYMLVFQKNS